MNLKSVTFAKATQMRKECSENLAFHNCRLKLIFGIFILAASLLYYPIITGFYTYGMEPNLDYAGEPVLSILILVAYVALCILYTFFFILPLFYGLVRMGTLAEEKEDFELIELFAPFSTIKNYAKSLKFSWHIFWKLLLLLAPIAVTYVFFFENELQLPILYIAGGICIALEFLFWLLFVFPVGFAKLYFNIANFPKKKRMPYQIQWKISLCYRLEPFWWFLLSLLTVGILLVADFLPRMFILYSKTCKFYTSMIE